MSVGLFWRMPGSLYNSYLKLYMALLAVWTND